MLIIWNFFGKISLIWKLKYIINSFMHAYYQAWVQSPKANWANSNKALKESDPKWVSLLLDPGMPISRTGQGELQQIFVLLLPLDPVYVWCVKYFILMHFLLSTFNFNSSDASFQKDFDSCNHVISFSFLINSKIFAETFWIKDIKLSKLRL